MKNIYDIFTMDDIIVKLQKIYGNIPIIVDTDISQYQNYIDIFHMNKSLFIILMKN